MDEFNAGSLKDAFDFFILKRFADGPLSTSEIQQRLKPIQTFLDLLALKQRKASPGSLLKALERLQHRGCLKAEHQGSGQSEVMVYSLTASGRQHLEVESIRQESIVSQFVETSELDKSFSKFLTTRRSAGAN